jgi:RNA-directed DNA polymerase
MQTCFTVSKRKNGGRTMKVRPSITLDDETDKLIGNPSVWNEHKCISFHNKEITNQSLPAESPNEKLTNIQLKTIWNNIEWHKVEKHVNRLQVRITKAVTQKKWNLVKRLSYLLTHSQYAKLLAVRKVTQNKGKRTAGIDGIRWRTPEAKIKAALSLTDRQFKAKPLKRIYIEKYGKKEKRPLGIPTMYDRAMQALYALALNPYAEATADSTSFGFRKYRSAQHACATIFNRISRKCDAQWILEGDIKGCFDNISHEWLLDNIPMDKSILKQFLKAGYVSKHILFPTNSGTTQGSILSPILSNITLDGIEKILDIKYHSKNNKISRHIASKYQVNFVKYADDFIVTARTKEIAEEVKVLIGNFLKQRGLELSNEKTQIIHTNDGFDFLSWNFRKYNGKLLIKPSKKSIQKITREISDVIRNGKTWTQQDLIDTLNPIITGWSNYHQGVVSKSIFRKIDSRIWNMLWKWAKRRHPHKSKKWIANKYWQTIGNRKWVFDSGNIQLKYLSNTKIIRTIPIKLDKNPYLDKDYWFDYKTKERNRKLMGMYKSMGKQKITQYLT